MLRTCCLTEGLHLVQVALGMHHLPEPLPLGVLLFALDVYPSWHVTGRAFGLQLEQALCHHLHSDKTHTR